MSTSTASRALNRPELVSPPVADRVKALAEELGYAPNPFARSLRMQDSQTIGLIVPDNTNPFFAEVAKGVEAACFEAGYTLIFGNSERSLDKELAQARVLYEKRVDGVLVFNASDRSAPTLDWLIARDIPVVLLERHSPGPAVDAVLSDNPTGTRLAVEHLAALGHRRVGCLMGDLDANHYAERLSAFHAAVRDLGLEADADLVRPNLVAYQDGQHAAAELLALAHPPTALFCANDSLAIGAIRGAAVAGRRVPEDVSVVGYGDTEVAAYVQPPLTSVVQEKLAVGAEAVRVLLRRIAARDEPTAPPTERVIPTRLAVRESTGLAPGAETTR